MSVVIWTSASVASHACGWSQLVDGGQPGFNTPCSDNRAKQLVWALGNFWVWMFLWVVDFSFLSNIPESTCLHDGVNYVSDGICKDISGNFVTQLGKSFECVDFLVSICFKILSIFHLLNNISCLTSRRLEKVEEWISKQLML